MVQTMTKGPVTTAEVLEVVAGVHDLCRRLDPDAIPLHEVPDAFDALASLERLGGGAVLRMAARYDEAGAWKRNGAKSAEDDIARKTGTPTGSARRKLNTSKRLKRQPKTDEAVRRGDVSPDQANEVSDGADASPEEEDELIRSARRDPLHELRKRSAAAKAKADRDREETRRRLQRAREVKRWNDAEGMGNLLLRLPADVMAEVDAALKPRVERAFADARDAGRIERREATMADVVRDLLLGGGGDDGAKRSSQAVRPEKKVIALIDVPALNRGRVEGDETCEIVGVGPVSVSAVRALLSDAFLALVFRDGEDVRNVTHLGRQVTARQRTAMEARGCHCEREGCGGTYLLDIDHNEGWTLTHDTRLDDLSWLCWHCHDLKTRNDLRLVGPPGRRRFETRKGRPWHAPPASGGPPGAVLGDGGTEPPTRRPEPEQGTFTLAD
ncbi:MAG TPA: hypothetical protein DCS55_14455 [Acidimicrobiaceae bacterium]|nr:hypothetical protein [Acidimicrobiaceae bacterium]